MSFLRQHRGRAALILAVLALPASLGGCFATQKDLEPMRSDISVLEKQFMDVQKAAAKARYSEGDKTALQEMGDRISDVSTRLSAVEKRLDALEAGSGAAGKPSEPEPVPQPMVPEPAVVEPAGEAPGGQAGPSEAAPQPTGDMEAASGLYKQAREAFDKGDYAAAQAQLEKLLSTYPKDGQGDEARYLLGEIHFTQKDYQKAVAEYERVPADYPVADRVPDALYKAGICYENMGQADKAREAYTRVMDNYPYSEAAKSARERLDKLKQ